jgi:hypothetical protein
MLLWCFFVVISAVNRIQTSDPSTRARDHSRKRLPRDMEAAEKYMAKINSGAVVAE